MLTIAVLEQENIKAREALTRLSHVTPSDLSTTLKHRYHLRGVATKPNVTYILRPLSQHESQQDDMDIYTDNDAPSGMQWWRIEYDVNANNARILQTSSTTDDVLRAVELEHTQALLVYASDRAITFESNAELSRNLRQFIELDNEQFAEELLDHQGFGQSGWNTQPPSSRRQSMDSTTVNVDDRMHDDLPPAYDAANHPHTYVDEKTSTIDPTQMSGVEAGYDSPPAHEIRLDDDEENQEMVDTGAGLFNPVEEERRKSDSTMMDVNRETE